MPTVTRLTSNGVFQSSGGFDEVSLNSGSIYFDGSSYLNVGTNSSLVLGTGSFTAETWLYLTAYPASGFRVIFGTNSVSGFNFALNSTGTISSSHSNVSGIITTNRTVPLNTWTHVAVVRNGTNYDVYINGLRSATTVTNSSNFSNADIPRVGTEGGFNNFNGNLSNLRIVKGTALYTANFIPSTAIVNPITNTSLLLSVNPQNPFKDSSVNNLTITKAGTPSFNTLGPFYYPANTSINLANTNNNPILGSNTNIITSTTSNGVVMISNEFDEVSMSSGSLYFSGSPNYLSLSANPVFNFSTNDFTIEAWIYTGSSTTQTIIDTRSTDVLAAYLFDITSTNKIDFIYSASRVTSSASITLNAWNHVAVTRASGTIRLFINGIVDVNTASYALDINASSFPSIGGGRSTGSTAVNGYYFNGNLSNLRVVKGTALYTSNFIPPQIALSPIANTVLLLNNFAAQPFVDNSGNNNTITINGSVTSNTLTLFANTQRKILNTGIMMIKEYDEMSMSSQSISFNGTNQYLTVPDNVAWDFTGNFTIEAWVYITSYGASGGTITSQSTNNASNQWAFRYTNTGSIFFAYVSGGSGVGTGGSVNTIPLSTWTYVTMTKTGSTVNFYINGVKDVTEPTVASSFTGSTSVLYIGSLDPANGFYFTGNMSNLRIVNGTAVYSANFAPPKLALSSITNTQLLLNNFPSETFVDNGPNNFIVTRVNSPVANTFTPFV